VIERMMSGGSSHRILCLSLSTPSPFASSLPSLDSSPCLRESTLPNVIHPLARPLSSRTPAGQILRAQEQHNPPRPDSPDSPHWRQGVLISLRQSLFDNAMLVDQLKFPRQASIRRNSPGPTMSRSRTNQRRIRALAERDLFQELQGIPFHSLFECTSNANRLIFIFSFQSPSRPLLALSRRWGVVIHDLQSLPIPRIQITHTGYCLLLYSVSLMT